MILIKKISFSILLTAMFICCNTANYSPKLNSTEQLYMDHRLKSTGKMLINLDYGIHFLGNKTSNINNIFIAVHGYKSTGYEWIYFLKKVHEKKFAPYFYRWNWNQCPEKASNEFLTQLKVLIKKNKNLKEITIAGHSYGGVILAKTIKNFNIESSIKVNFHIIASPLIQKHSSMLSNICNYSKPEQISPKKLITITQWRTKKNLDGAFKKLDYDPQIFKLNSAKIINLPNEYNGKRLGHNRSILWFTDQLL